MENRIKQFINDNKCFVIFYLSWFLFNLVILVTRNKERIYSQEYLVRREKWGSGAIADLFWPFGTIKFAAYDKTEFIFYLITPFVLLGIWKLIKQDVKNYIKDYQTKRSNVDTKKQKKRMVSHQLLPSKIIKRSGVITLLIISIIIWFIFYSLVALMEMQGKSSLEMARNGNFYLFILRIATAHTLIKKAKEFNANKWGWGIFGFFLPNISLIAMLVKINKSNRLFKNSVLTKEIDETH